MRSHHARSVCSNPDECPEISGKTLIQEYANLQAFCKLRKPPASRILPEIRDRYPDLPPPTPDETSARIRLFEAASTLVAAFAERSETVVFFVDDLQWADAATLDFLRYAARRSAEGAVPVLLVANLRAEALELDPRLSGWWAGVSRDLPAVRLALEPLSEEDTVRLLGALVDVDRGASKRPGWSA